VDNSGGNVRGLGGLMAFVIGIEVGGGAFRLSRDPYLEADRE
jgi:hypothetical protein